MTPTNRPGEPYVLVDSQSSPTATSFGEQGVQQDFSYIDNGRYIDNRLTKQLLKDYPSHIMTVIPSYNCNILDFAADGQAVATLDNKTVPFLYKQGVANNGTGDRPPWIITNVQFAKYDLVWQGHDFIMFVFAADIDGPAEDFYEYVLRRPRDASEVQHGQSLVTNALLLSIGEWQVPKEKALYVYDNAWTRSPQLYKEVEKASWDDVILSAAMKHDLTHVVTRFFDSKTVYEELGVPWRRGLIFHGVAGNGKTITIKAIMAMLTMRATPIPTLYVKQATNVHDIRNVFLLARRMAPCCLVLEDMETIVNDFTRSYFFNEVDGLEPNDGILILGTTNHLEDLDTGLSKRPNRFDRKYHFPLPSADDRALYVDYWRSKMAKNTSVYFPKSLSTRVASLTKGFTFAYMQEAFVTALLVLAGKRSDATMARSMAGMELDPARQGHSDEGDEDCELFTVLEREILALKAEMDTSDEALNDGGNDGAGARRVRDNGRQPLPPHLYGFANGEGTDRWNPFVNQLTVGTNQRIPRNVM